VRPRPRVLFLLLFALLALCACPPATDAPATARPQPAAATPAKAFSKSTGFRSPSLLRTHFEKHGAQFDAPTAARYLELAQALRDAPVSSDVLEIVRADGSITRFDKKTGAFLAFDADGTLRTFFRPNDGEDYFRRQARRERP
jgi:pyocin large subunit-like protein